MPPATIARRGGLAAALVLAAAAATGCLAHGSTADPAAPGPGSDVPVSAGAAGEQLAALRTAPAGTMAGYSRDRFGHGWAAQPGSACDTREIVLQKQGTGVASDPRTCKITSGTWLSLYDGVTVHDPRQLDIDHLVPEAEAWRTGAASWTAEQRKRFANDWAGGELVAVTAHSNRSKSDQPPPGFRPARAQWCRYATGWIAVKHRYQLTVSAAERTALADMLGTCGKAGQ